MSTDRLKHSSAAGVFNNDESRTDWHDETLWFVREKRDKAAFQIPEWEELREMASQIKDNVLANMHNYLVEFETHAKSNGIIVHWASDAEQHNKIVHAILKAHNIKQLVKSKSMLTEECHLNEFLIKNDIDVIDSDLGERIVQLRNEPPSHIVLPAIHLKREDVSKTFHEYLGTAAGNNDPQYLTEAARLHLRETFLTRKAALTGVNFAVAETGEIVICTNEGNADMGVHLADVHIASMGFEKIIPERKHLGVFLRLLARSATGQPITTFSSHFTSPRNGKQLHVVIVDNGRSTQLGRADFRNSLKCIRCGACMNTCPVYRRSGGHSYHNAVAGPIGSILAPNLDMKKNADLPFASTLCGSCTNVCPVKIDIHNQLYKWRQELVKEGFSSTTKTILMKGITTVLANPMIFDFTGKAGRFVIKNLPFMVNNKLNPWYKQRDMPDAPKESFREWYQKNGKEFKKRKMSERNKILDSIKRNQPKNDNPLPNIVPPKSINENDVSAFCKVLLSIGGSALEVKNYSEISDYILKNYAMDKRIITTIPQLSHLNLTQWQDEAPHSLNDVELAIVGSHFGVAENSALWVTEELLGQRVAAFIPQFLAIVVERKNILSTMHHAYERIGSSKYGFGTFIAGPSKTADIEQSLVIGAHGSRGLIVFILG